jgi:hypothetical protein
MKNVVESIFKNIVDKFGSPFFGSFTFMWCFIHWKYFVIIFNSDVATTEKIRFIQDSNYTNYESILIPLGVAVGYTIFSALVKKGTEFYNARIYKLGKVKINEWLNEAVSLTDFNELENKYNAEIELTSRLRDEVEKLSSQLNSEKVGLIKPNTTTQGRISNKSEHDVETDKLLRVVEAIKKDEKLKDLKEIYLREKLPNHEPKEIYEEYFILNGILSRSYIKNEDGKETIKTTHFAKRVFDEFDFNSL